MYHISRNSLWFSFHPPLHMSYFSLKSHGTGFSRLSCAVRLEQASKLLDVLSKLGLLGSILWFLVQLFYDEGWEPAFSLANPSTMLLGDSEDYTLKTPDTAHTQDHDLCVCFILPSDSKSFEEATCVNLECSLVIHQTSHRRDEEVKISSPLRMNLTAASDSRCLRPQKK